MAKKAKSLRGIRRVIAVAFPAITEIELALLDGIREAAASQPNWEILVLTGGYEGVLRQLAELGELSGAIGDFVSDAWLRDLRDHGVKVVQLAQYSHMDTVADVAPDYAAMGRGAAQALRGNGVKAFAFLGVPGQYASQKLFEGFSGELADFGSGVAASNGTSPAQVREFLRLQPRPLGVFSASDRLARFAVLAARELEWLVPEDMAVIGVGDVRLESLYAGLPLSSYALPSRELGRLAAQSLARQFQADPEAEGVPMRPLGILHERKSSLRSPTGLERALTYARSNLDQPLQVGDLCRVAGMSRRSLEMAMHNAAGVSPALYLQKLRQERAETLLRTTQMSIQAIARACGYGEPSVFSTAFRRWTHTSPSAFRAAAH